VELTHVCIVTDNVEKLKSFYKEILQADTSFSSDSYVEFALDKCTLAIFDKLAHEKLAPGSVEVQSNKCVMLEFKVEDVDREYSRLDKIGNQWVKHPTTQPWGNRSIYFRDPDGNLVNFYSRL